MDKLRFFGNVTTRSETDRRYSIAFLVASTIFLTVLWALGAPLGLQVPYTCP